MSAFNILITEGVCDGCGTKQQIILQFKYGDTWQLEYKIGDELKWGGNDKGNRVSSCVLVEAACEGKCNKCNDWLQDFVIHVNGNHITSARTMKEVERQLFEVETFHYE